MFSKSSILEDIATIIKEGDIDNGEITDVPKIKDVDNKIKHKASIDRGEKLVIPDENVFNKIKVSQIEDIKSLLNKAGDIIKEKEKNTDNKYKIAEENRNIATDEHKKTYLGTMDVCSKLKDVYGAAGKTLNSKGKI